MCIFGFLFKSKKQMAKKGTPRVRLGKYEISSHAQNRTVDASRNLSKFDMVRNLYGRSKNSKPYTHIDGTVQYDRVNDHNRTITHVTKDKNVVKSIRKYHNNAKAKHKAHKNF